MTAQEARKLVSEYNSLTEVKIKALYDNIILDIARAAKGGKSELSIGGVPHAICNKLIADGFTVTNSSHRNEDYTTIKW